MAKDKKKVRLGLSFGAEDICLVQSEITGKQHLISDAAEISNSVPFSIDLITESGGAEMVGTELNQVLLQREIQATEAAVSLDLQYGNVIKIPYDKKLSDKDLKTHLSWELQQYIDEDIEDYTFDSYKLVQTPSLKKPQLILAGTRTKVVDFFRNVTEAASLELTSVNIDILSAVNAFEANYQFSPEDKIALVEVGEQKLVFTLMEGNNFIGHHIQFLDNSISSSYTESVTEIISMNLKTLFADHDLAKDKSAFDHVYLYRSNSKYSVADIAESAGDDSYTIFNPFEKLQLSPDVSDIIDNGEDSSGYVEAVGLTLL